MKKILEEESEEILVKTLEEEPVNQRDLISDQRRAEMEREWRSPSLE